MAVPSSGQLRLRADIALEVDGSATGDNVSLGTLADSAGFDTPPDTMSEFYGYVSYIQPTMTGTPTTSSVGETSMIVTSPTFSNPSGGTITLGFYFGTSTTMTNNTFYAHVTYTGTGGFSFARQFTGLSSSTTYRAWAVLRDTQSPARFTEVVSNRKDQATFATLVYTVSQSNSTSAVKYDYSTINSSNSQGQFYTQYNHTYYGWTNAATTSWNETGPSGAWNESTFYGRSYSVDRSGVSVPNRFYVFAKATSSNDPNGSPCKAEIRVEDYNTNNGVYNIVGRSWTGGSISTSTSGSPTNASTNWNGSSTISNYTYAECNTNGTGIATCSGNKDWATP